MHAFHYLRMIHLNDGEKLGPPMDSEILIDLKLIQKSARLNTVGDSNTIWPISLTSIAG